MKVFKITIDKILATHASTGSASADAQEWEQEIDHLVYKLYDLTAEEIKIVEKE